ncbi:hypothetical protein [Pendulispora albinea]|uniref:HEAT repeat domain-containing protein n=1 Tax=Pendulispora albinea TaxID=2741071 RepID=A0ABZ2LU66_9BACT
MNGLFDQLGARIDARWFRAHYRERTFADICARALAEMAPARHVNADELLDWGLGCRRLPRQMDIDANFAEPPLTLFVNDRFHIAAYFWLDGTTCIHEHGFCGAFQVLEGGSLHTTFDFEPCETVSEHLVLGALTERRVERLRRGDVRAIHAGAAMIHSLFHLERPSATIVVRTHASADVAAAFRPQYSYSRAGVAWDPWYDRSDRTRRLQLLQLTRRTHPQRLPALCERWLGRADTVSAFLGLRRAATLLSAGDCDELLRKAERTHAVIAPIARKVIDNDRREAAIVARRTTVADPRLRFFLAILLNVRGRAQALRLVREEFPGRNPVDCVLECVEHLARLPSPFERGSSALGFEADETVLAALRGLLEGRSGQGLVSKVGGSLGRPAKRDERKDIARLCEGLRRSEMFRFLLA